MSDGAMVEFLQPNLCSRLYRTAARLSENCDRFFYVLATSCPAGGTDGPPLEPPGRPTGLRSSSGASDHCDGQQYEESSVPPLFRAVRLPFDSTVKEAQ